MTERISRTKVKEAAQGNIQPPRTKSGKIKNLSAAKRQKLLDNLAKIEESVSELSSQLSEIDTTMHN